MTDYQYTQDWFNWAPEVWEQLIPLLPKNKAFLEIVHVGYQLVVRKKG